MAGVPPVLSSTTSLRKHLLDNRTPIPTKTQWDFVELYLDALTPSSPHPTIPSWLDRIDPCVLSTLLAKKRSELDISHSDKQPVTPPRKDSGVSLLDHHVVAGSSSHSPPPQAAAATANSALRFQPNERRARHFDQVTDRTPIRLNTACFHTRGGVPGRLEDHEQLSPLSPTFGPRRGMVLSGTVKRRRTSAPNVGCIYDDESSATRLRDGQPSHQSPSPEPMFLDGSAEAKTEGRIIPEAAWAETEKNIDNYGGKFMDACHWDQNGGNEAIWRQLVSLRFEEALSSPRPFLG